MSVDSVSQTALPGVLLVRRRRFGDGRGFVMEMLRSDLDAASGLPAAFVQVNRAHSVRHTIRGLHWQQPHLQGKLVTVVSGRILDVVVDVRRGSPTFGRHIGVPLDAQSGDQLWVPSGFAHGFYVESDTADVLYFCTAVYDAHGQAGVRWDDPALGIAWPTRSPILSEKDAALPSLKALAADRLPAYIPT